MERLPENELTAKYCLNSLELKKSGSSVERIGTTLFNSKIRLTPHQIQAALFAFKSPIRKGVILADEVGLGKTIEAGIVIAQTWFEKQGKVMIVAPAALMRQWQNELEEKFGLSSVILDRKLYSSKLKAGYSNPITAIDSNILICSYQMCAAFKDDIRTIRFELVIIDEAHKLRNVHNEKSVIANNVKYALQPFKKILLTATPIQNNLMDLYGLCSIIDEDIFGDKTIFKYNYIRNYIDNEEDLEQRLKFVLHRTLRNQVQQYVQFTNRIPKTFSFELTSEEIEVYDSIRKLLNNSEEESYLIPNAQKHLLVLVLCKLMGSSMHSIVHTLNKMKGRLESLKFNNELINIEFDEFDELDEEEQELQIKYQDIDMEKLNSEIQNLSKIIAMASNVQNESKYYALLESLCYSFEHLKDLGAEEKVLIFTESRRTQDYLYESLKRDGYTDILLYNGTNNTDESKKIYAEWVSKELNKNKIKASRSVNMRAAILDKFKETGKILIATEAGAEGLNLQFCSLVINYDLPWNPQRVEQRIGRCHRFGQLYDVVVINFISANNIVEQRIYDLLNDKFRLFKEVLGSSDSVLGSIEDGKDIEKSIIDIYSKCRTNEEINEAFDQLQEKYKDDISVSMERTKEELLDNFEEDVQSYFNNVMDSTEKSISQIEMLFWKLLISLWNSKITVIKNNSSFSFEDKKYCISTHNDDANYIDFNLSSLLGKRLIEDTRKIQRTEGHITFDITNYPFKLTRIEKLKGKKGALTLKKLVIKSFENEEFLIFNGILDSGERLEPEICHTLFRLETKEYKNIICTNETLGFLQGDSIINIESVLNASQVRNNEYLSEEIAKINAWTDDKIQAVQLDVESMRMHRKELQQQSDVATNMQEKEHIENEILQLSNKIRQSWMKLAMTEEDVELERKNMIDAIKKENMKESTVEHIFTVSFEVI